MPDTWGTLAAAAKADGAVHGLAELANTAVDIPAAFPEVGSSAAGSAVAADPELVRCYQQYATWCGYLVIAIGCIALIGWFTGIRVLTSLNPSWVAMKSNTALGFLAAGSSLCLNSAHLGERRWARQVSCLCALFVIVLAGGTLVEHVSGRDLGIDQLLVTEPPGAISTIHPGRMASLAMVSFVIFGISLLTMPWARSGWQMVTSALGLLAIVLSMVVLLGYLFGASDIYSMLGESTGVAANTSIAFLVLGVGILFTNLPTGLLRSLASPYLGGVMLRRMLPGVVALIIGIVWLRLIAQSAELLGTGVATGAVAIIVAVEGILIWYAGVLDRLDGARRLSDERIRQLNATLKARVLGTRGGEQGTPRLLLFDVARAARAIARDPWLRTDLIG